MKQLIIGCAILERELRHLVGASGQPVDLVLIEQGLHEKPAVLRSRLQSEIDRHDGQYDRIMIAYGLCSNALEGVQAGVTPLLVPRAHDCITLLLGSRDRYRSYFDAHEGTYWYSVGWLATGSQPGPDYLDKKKADFLEDYDEETADFLIEEERKWIDRYRTACFIRHGLVDESDHLEYTKQAAETFGWQMDVVDGDLTLLADLVAGHEDETRFLLVPPGRQITASFREDIVTHC